METLPTLKTLAERLVWARKRRAVTQQELADHVGVTRELITAIEAGRSRMPRKIKEIAQYLKISPGWLQFGIEQIDHLSKEGIELALQWENLTEDQKASIKALIASMAPKPESD